MTKATHWLLVLLLVPVLAFAQGENDDAADGDSDSSEELVTMTIAQVPPEIMKTARQAGPDVYFNAAARYWENDFRVYRISGRLFREVWNIYVREDGKLLRKESDTQDD